MGGIEPGWWLPPQARPAAWTTSSGRVAKSYEDHGPKFLTGNGGDASSFHLLSFLSFGFSVSTTRRAIPLALGGSSLVDSSATSPLVEEGKKRRFYRWLCSRKDDGDLDGELESVALLGDTAMSQTVGFVDEGKRRSDYWWLSETQINAAEC
ncbi:hypothetical protein F2Q68_00018145 [Brassica cretica]|uniref:Uncharacterized protein n=1 Tax=Brassica cretica TaxID=69181 RepID=A0A8S9HML8_BRACR|nr:hypothetical protein F2Q68_00018145 [Brassica cretica]